MFVVQAFILAIAAVPLGKHADLMYHTISNQAFYDIAQALGATSVKLAPLHLDK